MLTSKKIAVFCAGAIGVAIAAACGDSQVTGPKPDEHVESVSSALLAPAWSITGPLNVSRQNHAAALLQSGLVLVAGGHPGNNVPTATAETYNPSTQVWTSVGSMGTARRLFGACTLASGKVLVAGGNAGTGDVSSAELFDPSTNTWAATGSLAHAREDFSMTCLSDGRVLVAGGSASSGLLNSAEVYSPTAGTWSSAGTIPAAVHTQGAVQLSDGRVLIAGGNGSLGPVATAATWNPSTNAWSATGSMATTRSFFALNLLGDGRVLAAGGLVNAVGTATNAAEIYSPSAGTWSAAAHLNTARYSGVSANLAAGPIVIGGVNGGSPLSTSESYDPVHNTWTQVGTAYGAVNQTAVALTATSVVVAGGNIGGSPSQATASAQIYGLLNVFALYAERSITLGSTDHVIGGDVGVAAAAGSTFPQLVVGASSTVQTNHNLVAPSVSLGSGAQVGDVQTNSLTNSGATLGAVAAYPSSMPTMPLAPAPGSGGSDVNVPALTITTLNPGNFGALNITGTAYLNAGSYTFASVTMANQAHLAGVSGTAIVTVTGSFGAGNSVSISSPGGTPAGQLAITTGAYDSGSTLAFSVGTGAAISALLAAPHGTLSLGDSTLATGAFAGFDVKLGVGVTITHQSGFYAVQPPGQPVAGYTLPPSSAPILGPVPGGTPIGLAVVMPLQHASDLQAFNKKVTDPTSTQYRKYVSISTFASNYGDTPTEYNKVAPWATSFGLTATTYPNNLLVDVQGTAAQIEQALHANLVIAMRSDGTLFYEPDRLPTPNLPTAVDAIQLMDNFVAPQPLQTASPPGGGGPYFQSSDLRTAYLGTGTNCSSLTGFGQSIGIVAFDAFTQPGTPSVVDGGVAPIDDFTNFLSTSALTSCAANGNVQPCTPNLILRTVNATCMTAGQTGCIPAYPPNGANPGPVIPSGNTGSIEAALDVESAIAMAPSAQIVNIVGSSIDSILSAFATTTNVNQISDSWNAGSSTSQRFLDEFVAQGQSFFAASGDAGQYDLTAQSCPCACTNSLGLATTETLAVCNGSCPSTCQPPPDGGAGASADAGDASAEAGLPALACSTNFSNPLDGPLGGIRAKNNIVLVGGTALTTCKNSNIGPCAGAAANTEGYSSETAWAPGPGAGSGGGLVPGTPLPDFQTNVPGVDQSARNSPDVSMPATGVLVVSTGCGPIVGPDGGTIPGTFVNNRCPVANLQPGLAGGAAGTSVAAPLWAGFMALINQAGASQTPVLPSMGYPNVAFYQLLQSANYSTAFHDIVGGPATTNECGGAGPVPVTGYDQATGLGSPTCGLIGAIDALASPPQATIQLTGLQLGTTGSNFNCSACNCPKDVVPAPQPIVCNPISDGDGGFTQGSATAEFCDSNHAGLVTVTCSPSAPSPLDAGNGAPGRGIDVTVTIALENNCGNPGSSTNAESATATNVLPATPQTVTPSLSCNTFGTSSLCASGGDCTWNAFGFFDFGSGATVTNTGGFFRHQ